MRKWKWSLHALAALLLVTLASAQLSGGGSLSAAYAAGQVSVSAHGLGGSSGGSVQVDVAKTGKAPSRPVSLTVDPGTRLSSNDSSAQSMVIARVLGRMAGGNSYSPSPIIVVPSTKRVSYIVEAYCAEFEKENPSTDTGFKLRSADPVLRRVLTKANRKGLSIQAKQAAVWMITDGITFDHMNQKFHVSQSDWDKAEAIVQQSRN